MACSLEGGLRFQGGAVLVQQYVALAVYPIGIHVSFNHSRASHPVLGPLGLGPFGFVVNGAVSGQRE